MLALRVALAERRGRLCPALARSFTACHASVLRIAHNALAFANCLRIYYIDLCVDCPSQAARHIIFTLYHFSPFLSRGFGTIYSFGRADTPKGLFSMQFFIAGIITITAAVMIDIDAARTACRASALRVR